MAGGNAPKVVGRLVIDSRESDAGIYFQESDGSVSTILNSNGELVDSDSTFEDATLTGTTSAENVEVSGSLQLSAEGASTSTASTLVPVMFTAATEVIAAGNPGAISVATYATHISADAGGDAFTLAAGTVVGQRKRIYFLATAGGTGVVTGAFRGANNTLTFTNAGEYAELIWDGTDWLDIELGSTDDTNIATPPALSTV